MSRGDTGSLKKPSVMLRFLLACICISEYQWIAGMQVRDDESYAKQHKLGPN